ncbi:zinc-ribbon domain-containing protein [Rubellicoccus peritrichatus]|uniref:Zinc-ribbon domain-containing protein n=1 Tax=Rubellicoccus peritrichatus TaxID=3080537 RepID=A0AAQ3LJ56_9BACT|nr:zinc-ribbon domain-containing protein [Puniceicoccus sp. CR14]WOO43129.1 zinc-ribbon domain-containing protein [Puniceicoccus sp. CR14]
MALISCSDCGKRVSSNAASCPNCGNPIKGVAQAHVERGVTKSRLKKDLGGAIAFVGIIAGVFAGVITTNIFAGIVTIAVFVGIGMYITYGDC